MKALVKLLSLVYLTSCATGGDKKKDDDKDLSSPSSKKESFDENNKNEGSSTVKADNFVVSLSNNPLTSKVISNSKADKVVEQFSKIEKGNDDKLKVQLAEKIAAQRVAKKGIEAILDTARDLADVEMKAGLQRGLPESVKLEIGIAAIGSKNYAMADFMLQPLQDSKNRKIAAGANNAIGVMFLKEGRIPEAVQQFKKAVSQSSDYEAAMLNLGFIALQYGDLETAEKMLGRVQGDWFTESAKLVIARQDGKVKEAKSICEKLASKNHKPTVFNCALNAWFGEKDAKSARELINKAVKMPGGPQHWEQAGYKVLDQIPANQGPANPNPAK